MRIGTRVSRRVLLGDSFKERCIQELKYTSLIHSMLQIYTHRSVNHWAGIWDPHTDHPGRADRGPCPTNNSPQAILEEDPARTRLYDESKSPHHNFSPWQWTRASGLVKTGADRAQRLCVSCATEPHDTRLAPKHLINCKFGVNAKWISTPSLQKHVNSGCFCETYVKLTHADKLNKKLVSPKLPRQEGSGIATPWQVGL